MQSTQTKRLFLVYEHPGRIIKALVIVALLLVGLYFYIGRMTFPLWALAAVTVIGFIQALRKTFDRGPCIVINEEGINDKRLRMGVIRWSDIERVRMKGIGGACFISLELFNKNQYLSRQPAHMRMSSNVWRIYDVSPINIKVAYMDVAPGELFEMILSEVELSRSRS